MITRIKITRGELRSHKVAENLKKLQVFSKGQDISRSFKINKLKRFEGNDDILTGNLIPERNNLHIKKKNPWMGWKKRIKNEYGEGYFEKTVRDWEARRVDRFELKIKIQRNRLSRGWFFYWGLEDTAAWILILRLKSHQTTK